TVADPNGALACRVDTGHKQRTLAHERDDVQLVAERGFRTTLAAALPRRVPLAHPADATEPEPERRLGPYPAKWHTGKRLPDAAVCPPVVLRCAGCARASPSPAACARLPPPARSRSRPSPRHRAPRPARTHSGRGARSPRAAAWRRGRRCG